MTFHPGTLNITAFLVIWSNELRGNSRKKGSFQKDSHLFQVKINTVYWAVARLFTLIFSPELFPFHKCLQKRDSHVITTRDHFSLWQTFPGLIAVCHARYLKFQKLFVVDVYIICTYNHSRYIYFFSYSYLRLSSFIFGVSEKYLLYAVSRIFF